MLAAASEVNPWKQKGRQAQAKGSFGGAGGIGRFETAPAAAGRGVLAAHLICWQLPLRSAPVNHGVGQHKQHMKYRGWSGGTIASCFKHMLPHVAKCLVV